MSTNDDGMMREHASAGGRLGSTDWFSMEHSTMNLKRTCLLLAWVLLVFPWVASAQARDQPAISAQEDEVLRKAGIEGLELFRHDQAASVASDALAADRRKFRKISKKLGGWVTEAIAGEQIRVSFLDRPKHKQVRHVLATVVVNAKGRVTGKPDWLTEPVPLSPWESAAANAVQKASLSKEFQRCTERYNSVVVPGSAGGLSVWLLPATTDAGIIPFGGAWRFEFDAMGESIRQSRSFTKSCIQLQRPTEGQPMGMMISHMLDPVPTALHVWASLTAGLPFYVVTMDKRLWVVEGAEIRLLERDIEKAQDDPARPDS